MMKSIITPVLFLLALTLGISSCKKEDTASPKSTTAQAANTATKCMSATPPVQGPPAQTCGTSTVVSLVSGQCTVGTVTVANDASNLYVTYATTGSWKLHELHVYAGDTALVPKRQGGPDAGQFPYSVNLNNSQTQYTFTIPLSGLSACFYVFAEAEVSSGGYGCAHTTVWGAGTRFTTVTTSTGSSCNSNNNYGNHCNGNNNQHRGDNGGSCNNNNNSNCSQATYFSVCKQTCTSTCIYSVSLLFGGENAWPNGVTSVVVGGYTYTENGISSSVYPGPDSDAKTALLLIATLKIYGNTIYPPSSVVTAATTVENWLSTLGQLTSTSSFTAPAAVANAIAIVQAWETGQTCQ